MQTITFHSYKGGTGKSYLSSNLAAVFAEKEKVCLLDMDLEAPTLQTLFNVPDHGFWINDYVDGHCATSDFLVNVGRGNLFLGMADSQPEAIRASLGKSKEREMRALKRLLSLKEELAADGFDRLILDTGPGYEYSSINSIAAADKITIVSTLYRPDMLGSKAMMAGIYEVLEKPVIVIVNRYHNERLLEEFISDIDRKFKVSVFGMKCFCDEADSLGNKVIFLENPDHEWSKSFRYLAEKMEKEF
jgi:septum site-determining protein MinD